MWERVSMVMVPKTCLVSPVWPKLSSHLKSRPTRRCLTSQKSEGRLLEPSPHPWVGGGRSGASPGRPPSDTLTPPHTCNPIWNEKNEIRCPDYCQIYDHCVSAIVVVSLPTAVLCEAVVAEVPCVRGVLEPSWRRYLSGSMMLIVLSMHFPWCLLNWIFV